MSDEHMTWPFSLFFILSGAALFCLHPTDDVLLLVSRVWGVLLVLVGLGPVVDFLRRLAWEIHPK